MTFGRNIQNTPEYRVSVSPCVYLLWLLYCV